MARLKIGINGFGRIGRTLFRLLANHKELEVIAINDFADANPHDIKNINLISLYCPKFLAPKSFK